MTTEAGSVAAPTDGPEPVIAADVRAGGALEAILEAARPRQWPKNLLVIAAPGAAGVLARASVLGRTAIAFAALCLVSSGMYLVNDVLDAEADRRNPRTCGRPVASGRLAPAVALAAAGVLSGAGLAVAVADGLPFLGVVAGYSLLTLAYSLRLKRVAVLDLAAVAAGFVLRAVAGGVATGVPVSEWFLILVSAGSVFVVAGKRHRDYADLASTPAGVSAEWRGPASPVGRPVEYTARFLRYVWTTASAVAIAGYCLWAFAEPEVHRGFGFRELSTIPFVLAVLRYALLLDTGQGAAPEDLFLGDRPLQALVGCWLVVYTLGVYVGH